MAKTRSERYRENYKLPKPTRAGTRKCLRCDKKFKSRDRINLRICDHCKCSKTGSSGAASNDDSMYSRIVAGKGGGFRANGKVAPRPPNAKVGRLRQTMLANTRAENKRKKKE